MTRALVLAAGLATAAYGVVLLLARGWANLVGATTWLVGGVVLHDALLAPLTVAVCWVVLRVVGTGRAAPWAVALVLLGPVTLLAVPVLGRFGARPDNPTLLDRPYWWGWTAVVLLVVAGILVVTRLSHWRAPRPVRGGDHGQGDGGR